MLKILSHLLFSNFFYLLKQLLIELEQLQHFDVICYVCFPVYSSLFPITSLPPNTNSIQHLGRGNYLFLSPFFFLTQLFTGNFALSNHDMPS